MKKLDKQNQRMLQQIIGSLSHMYQINDDAEKQILSEIERIKANKPVIVKKKEAVAVAIKEEKNLQKELIKEEKK